MNQPLIFRGSSLVFCSIYYICSIDIDLLIFPIDPILACDNDNMVPWLEIRSYSGE